MLSIITNSKTFDEIAKMPVEELINCLQSKGRDPEALAKLLGKLLEAPIAWEKQ